MVTVNKMLLSRNGKKPTKVKCNCRNKSVCSLHGNFQQNHAICKCIAFTSVNQDEAYLGTAEVEFKERYYNIISCSDTTVILMKPLFLSTYGKSMVNARRSLLENGSRTLQYFKVVFMVPP